MAVAVRGGKSRKAENGFSYFRTTETKPESALRNLPLTTPIHLLTHNPKKRRKHAMHFEKDDIPPGFGMLLGRNENAMKCFSGMTDTEKEDVIRQAQARRSTDDIAQIIECTLR